MFKELMNDVLELAKQYVFLKANGFSIKKVKNKCCVMKSIFLKIYNLFTKKERQKVRLLLFMMIVGMLLETLGIGLIIPVITLLMQGSLVSDYPMIGFLVNFFGGSSQIDLITTIMLGLLIVFVIKNSFLAFLA